jgi:class 3 adenylate cyclase
MELWNFLNEIFEDERKKIDRIEVPDLEKIPSEDEMALEIGRWFRIRNVVSIYVDMNSSTQLTNTKFINASAKIYQIFTGTLVRILKEFGAQFIDIKGDGGFALWKEEFASVKALLAGVTFKTFVEKNLKDFVKDQITDWDIASKIGIAKGMVLVKKIGLRNYEDQRYNWAVWVGTPVNFSFKLCDLAEPDTILVTNDIYEELTNPTSLKRYLILSCGCPHGETINLWTEKDELEQKFNTKIWELKSRWCDKHGEEYINKVLEIINRS